MPQAVHHVRVAAIPPARVPSDEDDAMTQESQPEHDRMAVANLIAATRGDLSNRKIAEKVGRSPQLVNEWCNGVRIPSAKDIAPLARALGIGADTLRVAVARARQLEVQHRERLDPETEAILATLDQLSPDDKRRLLAIARALVQPQQSDNGDDVPERT